MAEKVGIDFGTSTCKMARYVDGDIQHVPIGEHGGRVLVPSYLGFWEDRSGSLIQVGATARDSNITHEDVTYPSVIPGHNPIKLSLMSDDFVSMDYMGRTYDAQAMAEELFVHLLEGAAASLGYEPYEAVVTKPAYFALQAARLIKDAGTNAGLLIDRMIAEPVAAAVGHAWPDQLEGIVLVYDFGGGTVDTTVLRISGSQYEVLAKGGNPRLGGELLTEIVYNTLFRPVAEEATGFGLGLDHAASHPQGYDAQNRQELFNEAEAVKVVLSSKKTHTTTLPLYTTDGQRNEVSFSISRNELELAVGHLVDGTMETVAQTMEQAGLVRGDVDHVVAVGGTTRMPLVLRRLEQAFGEQCLRRPSDPDAVVSEGAALLAAEDLHLDIEVADVLTRALRMRIPRTTETRVLIPSGAPIDDATGSIYLKWPGGDQKEAALDLCEGDGDAYAENQSYGRLVISPDGKVAPGTSLEARFNYDAADQRFVAVVSRQEDGISVRSEIRTDVADQVADAAPEVTEVAQADLVLCIDVTGSFRRSMLGRVANACLKLETALREAEIETRFALVAYGDSRLQNEQPVVQPFSRLATALEHRLGSLPSFDGGDTPESVSDALQRAMGLLRSASPDSETLIILFTDAGPKSEEHVGELATRIDRPVHVFAPMCPYSEAYRALAEETGGHYANIHTELETCMRDLASRLLPH